MSVLEDIQIKFAADEFELSRHAFVRMLQRGISVADVRAAIAGGELIENYPHDKYGPSCLILGFGLTSRTIHVQCTHVIRPLLRVITAYEPEPALWLNWRHRR